MLENIIDQLLPNKLTKGSVNKVNDAIYDMLDSFDDTMNDITLNTINRSNVRNVFKTILSEGAFSGQDRKNHLHTVKDSHVNNLMEELEDDYSNWTMNARKYYINAIMLTIKIIGESAENSWEIDRSPNRTTEITTVYVEPYITQFIK